MSRVQTIVRRQWAIVRALHGTRRGKTIRALAEELGIPRATLYRDLGYLADAGVPIHRERINGEVRLSLIGPPLPELGPAALELAAMRIARGRLTSLEGTALVEHLDGLLAKWDANGHAQSISIRSQPPAHDPEALRRIDQAIRRQRRLHFDYRAADASDYARREVDPLQADIALSALAMALGQRKVEHELVAHSDRGSQYTSGDYRRMLREHGLTCSMSGKGNCWDNAVVESFLTTIKQELIYRRPWPTRREARQAIHEYIEVFYNRRRRHSTLGGLSPAAFERQQHARQIQAA